MSEGLIQRSLAGGEIDPALGGRADQVKYQTGLKICRNFRVLKHGGIANRAGTRFITEVKTSSKKTYLLKFVFNDDQTYAIEAGDLYFRFIRAGAQIIVSGVAAWSNATNYVIGNLAERLGVNYYCIAAHINQQPPNATYWYPLTGAIYEIPTPYVEADIAALEVVQSGDVVTIAHPNYDTRDLTRTGHTTWTLTAKTYGPSISAPTGVTNSGAAGSVTEWVVTAVKRDTYEESLQSSSTGSSAVPTSGVPITVSWTQHASAQEYNVYKKTNGIWGFIGIAGDQASPAFIDNGIVPNAGITPPLSRNPFSGAGNRASTVSYYQQRLMLANSNNATEKVWTSRSGMFNNLSISSPLQEDDAVTFTIAGKKVNAVRHMIDIGTLVILTDAGEFLVEGDVDGVLRANKPPNLRQIGYNGSSKVPPAVVSDSLVYLQARSTVIRDLKYTVASQGGQASYKGKDLTVFAGHLFISKTITRMDFAQIPNSIVSFIRSDGVLLGLTYLPEHEVWGWHRHDTLGYYEDYISVPEGLIDAEYVVVKRYVNGTWRRYIERFADREFTDIATDAIFVDSHLSYDGRNSGATTLSLSTGAGWTVNDTITITASVATFVSGDVGNAFVLNIIDSDPNSATYLKITSTVTITVTAFTDSTHVNGTPSKTVPTSLRGVATTSWSKAVDQLSGLDHLEGKHVSVFADGNVVANPNNTDYTTITVTAGAVTLDRPCSVIHVGLPYLSDLQTLDMDVHGEQIRGRKKLITHIDVLVVASRGIFAGPDFDTLDQLEPTPIENYGEPWPLETGLITMPIASTWGESGSFCMRQVDPLPLTVLSVIPSGQIGG